MAILKLVKTNLIFSGIFLWAITGCSFSTAKNPLVGSSKTQTVTGATKLGKIFLINGQAVGEPLGQPIDLDQSPRDSLVLIFASDACSVCAEEAGYWRQVFLQGLPQNVDFYHIMIGGIVEDSKDWADFHQVNWPLGISPGDALFKQYCQEIRTPCTLIINRKNGQIFQTYQVLKQIDIERKTGLWVF